VALAPLPLAALARSLSTHTTPGVRSGVAVGRMDCGARRRADGHGMACARGARVNTIQAITTAMNCRALGRLAGQAGARGSLAHAGGDGAKDAFARRGRAALTLLSLLLGVVSLVFSFALNDVINTFLREPSLAGVVYDAWVSREDISDSSARRTLERAPGVATIVAHTTAKVETADGKEFRVRAEEGNLAGLPFKLEAGRLINTDVEGEAMIGVGLQSWLGLSVRDMLRVTLTGKRAPVEWRIVGVYREPADNGQMASSACARCAQ